MAGALVGLLGALLGVGGGVLIVPILHLIYHLPLSLAVGTSLVVITGTSLAGGAGYLKRRLVDVELALGLELGALAGAYVASRLAPWVPEVWLARLFGVTLLATAVNLWWRSRLPEAGPVAPSRRWTAFLLSPVAGGAAGLLGIGGGLIQVPILRLVVGVNMLRAVATSTLMVGWTASVAAVIYLRRGEVEIPMVPWLLTGILAGAVWAPRLGSRMPRRALEIVFSLLLVYAALRMLR